MLQRMVSASIILLISASCTVSGIKQPSVPPPSPVLPVTPQDLDDCQRAEATLKQLDCRRSDGSPRWQTPAGATFTEYCRAAIEDGRSPRPDCIAKITDCSQVSKAQYSPEGMPCQN
jgi:hypothetical protein